MHNSPHRGKAPVGSQPQTNQTAPQQTVASALQRLGANAYNRLLPETRSLPRFLRPNEHVEGVVFGRYRLSAEPVVGRGMLVATSRRVMLIDHKPLFVSANEISYEVISGVTQSSTGLIGNVTLNTRLGDISIRTLNPRAATSFVRAIETHIFSKPANFRPITPHTPPPNTQQ